MTWRDALADSYRIEHELGRGAMAVVYLARDLRHQRPVAVKVFHPDAVDPHSADRFLAEIRVTATLQHPHILPLLDSGAIDGTLYYVMPYVVGRTLRERLETAGPLTVDEVVRTGEALAAALQHAHRQGIVHRDVKPENVLLADDLPVLADFGIARRPNEASTLRLTGTGAVVGTPSYISPEQVGGDRDVDGRADQYALACTLCELLTGRPPYVGASAFAVMMAHVSAEVPTFAGENMPASVATVLRRALAKDPRDRFPDMAAFGAALLASARTTSRAADTIPSVVVVPFANLSPDAGDAWFADGLTDEVISDLSKVGGLRVVSRTSAMQLKDQRRDARSIGHVLGVSHVLEGSVRRAGNSLRLTVQLVDATQDAPVWAEKFTGTLDDVFAIQERLAREIVDALRVVLTEGEQRRVGRRTVRDPVAYDCYLRAREFILGGDPSHFAAARNLLEKARAIVGENALVSAAAAFERAFTAQAHIEAGPGVLASALAFASQAVALDPDCSEAYSALGLVYKSLGNAREGALALGRALALEPNNEDALLHLSWIAAEAGHSDVARALLSRFESVSPFDSTVQLYRAIESCFDGRYAEALLHSDAFARSNPGFPYGLGFRVMALSLRGETAEALRAAATMEERFGEQADVNAIVALARGRTDAGPPLLSRLTADARAAIEVDAELSWWTASCLAAHGEPEAAVEWAQRTSSLGIVSWPLFAEHDPGLRQLRGWPPYDVFLDVQRSRWTEFRALLPSV